MSDELIEAETAPSPVTKPRGPSLATILGLILLAAALGVGIYIGGIWQAHNSRISRLKAKSGDFVQLEHRDDEDEFAARPRAGRGENVDNEEPKANKEPAEPAWYEKYTKDLFPKPIQVVYWRNPTLESGDVDLLLEFKDAEILAINCDSIGSGVIEKFLALPRIRRLSLQASEIDTSSISGWKADPKFSNLLLVNPKWSPEEIQEILDSAKSNESLKRKLDVKSAVRPVAGA